MKAYRITLEGMDPKSPLGAFEHGGRWNSKGLQAIYGSICYSNCILEVLTRRSIGGLRTPYIYTEITIPSIDIEYVSEKNVTGWNNANKDVSRKFGDAWIKEKRSAVLVVPSAVARPIEQNIVLNPLHDDYHKISWSEPQDVLKDSRIFD